MDTNHQVDYTVVIDGKPQGPFQLDELRVMKIKPGTFIRKPGMADYKEAHEFAELRELLGFTFQQTAPQYFASFDQRLLASAIDFFVITLFYIFTVLVSFVFIDDKSQRIIIAISLIPIIPVVKFIYGSFAEASSAQATVGKRLLAIKVTGMGGSRIDIPNSIGRNAAKVISVAPLFFGYLYSFLNRKQQCWHDIIANTLVIKDRLI